MHPLSQHVDPDQPSAARMYDYLLGGSYNFAADREMVQRVLTVVPDLPLMAQQHRAFLRRAVRFLAAAGIRQFIDIGSGIPTRGNVHEIAQSETPDARVVYVDLDPVAIMHSRDLLAGNDKVTIVQEDLRNPEAILRHPSTRALVRPDQPVALLLVAILHFLNDADDPHAIIGRLARHVAPGSYLVISHAAPLPAPPLAQRLPVLQPRVPNPMTVRDREQVDAFFREFPLLPPGLVHVSRWQPDHADEPDGQPELVSGYAGVGRKPAPAA